MPTVRQRYGQTDRRTDGRLTPFPHRTPLGAFGASKNAPSALDLSTLPPFKLKSRYAIDDALRASRGKNAP